jgi:hypothetical protein
MSISCIAKNDDPLHFVRDSWNDSYSSNRDTLIAEGADPEFCQKQSKVVLILSASRSGSSWLAELCSSSTQFSSLPGEIDPFMILALDHPNVSDGESDELSAGRLTPAVAEALSLQISLFAGNRSLTRKKGLSPKQLFQNEMRLLFQWPELHRHMPEVRQAIRETFEQTEDFSREARMLVYLKNLKRILPHVNPYYYDLDPNLIRDAFPDEPVPTGPPSRTAVIEESPFICDSSWNSTDRESSQLPLVLKSPSNAYRLDFLRALFPNAEITIVHVIREPAACVTGLMCGWLHHGFFKHRTYPRTLEIEGYTRPDQPWTAEWWKFDLPPGWTEYTHRRLEEVCRFQWISANEHILRWVQRNRESTRYVQATERMLAYDTRREMIRLFEELGLRADEGLLDALIRNRRTMVSYSITERSRAELACLAAAVTDCIRVRYVMDAFRDAGSSVSRRRVFSRPVMRARSRSSPA